MNAKSEALRMHEEGVPFPQIAATVGVHLSTVHRWSSPYALERYRKADRERYNGGPVKARECGGYGCHEVIGAEEYAGKLYCSRACKQRARRIRNAA